MSAQLLLGTLGPFIGPSITAITLGLVGKAAFDARLGRNAGFNSAGNFFSAATMGWIGWHWGVRAIFFAVPFLAVPTLLALTAIPAGEIDHARARGCESGTSARGEGLRILIHDRALVAFAAAGFLFHLANAAMLPQLGELLAHGRPREAVPFMSAAVSVTQIVVALGSTSVGKMSARWGPRRILLVGFAVLPIRGVLYTLTNAVPLLIAIQTLDGVANAIFGVASAVYVAERTRETGHFNLAMGAFGTAVGIGAALSTSLAGFVTERAGFAASFLVLAAAAGGALLCLATCVPNVSRNARTQQQTGSVRVAADPV
jgi:predicted MFS family arabinose efflux permease